MLKYGEQASIPMPKECGRLIQFYTEKYRRLLVDGETSYLFPGSNSDRSKRPGVMSTQLSRLIYNRLGFKVHPHLYRHLAHLVILKRFPGAYAMISRVLPHKSLETAVRNLRLFRCRAIDEGVSSAGSGCSERHLGSKIKLIVRYRVYSQGVKNAPRKST